MSALWRGVGELCDLFTCPFTKVLKYPLIRGFQHWQLQIRVAGESSYPDNIPKTGESDGVIEKMTNFKSHIEEF